MSKSQWIRDVITKWVLATTLVVAASYGTLSFADGGHASGIYQARNLFGGCLNCNCRQYIQGFDGLCVTCGHRLGRHF